jgi:hypothetical protein
VRFIILIVIIIIIIIIIRTAVSPRFFFKIDFLTSPDLQPNGVRARHEKVSACSSCALILLAAASLRR